MNDVQRTARQYRRFGEVHVQDSSPLYRRLSVAVSEDETLLELLAGLPREKRQPNLLLGAVRFLRGTTPEYPEFREFVLERRDEVIDVVMRRRTQTNEPARCSALLAVLAGLPGPFALLEVGASAGLCLIPDRYSYDYDGHVVGPADAAVMIRCSVAGNPPLPEALPNALPNVVWRAGIDLNPLDVNDDEEMRWLKALIWPEHEERRARFAAAVEVARADPPRIVRGDLNTTLDRLAADVPDGATLVVYHSAVLMYLDQAARDRFEAQVTALPGHWVSQEDPETMPGLTERLPGGPPKRPVSFVVALDGEPVALAGGHGGWLEWL
ncbi:DUF2332 domain-containing protein [Sinosporangium album]|nr:DUF2332 domain-containing protein [Sinosporangium album]